MSTATLSSTSRRISAPNATPVSSPTSSTHRLTPIEATRRLQLLVSSPHDRDTIIRETLEIAAGLTGALGVVYLSRDADGRLAVRPTDFSPPQIVHLRSLLTHMLRMGTVACAEQTPQASTEAAADILSVVVPVVGGPHGNEALGVAVGIGSPESVPATASYLTQLMTWTAAMLGGLQSSPTNSAAASATTSHFDLDQLRATLQQAAGEDTFAQAAKLIAEGLANQLECDTVVLGLRPSFQRPCRLTAYSSARELRQSAATIRNFEEVLEETVIGASIASAQVATQVLDETNSVTNLAHDSGLAVIGREVLRNGRGEAIGAMLLLRAHDLSQGHHANSPTDAEARVHRISLPPEAGTMVGTHLSLLQRAQSNWLARFLAYRIAGRTWYRQPKLYAVAALLGAALWIPMPMKIPCGCMVQPQTRRFVSAPYDGRLESVHVAPGEEVTSGMVLARMDGREVADELSGLRAQWEAAKKQCDQVWEDVAERQIAECEVERLAIQIRKWEERQRNLCLLSPLDGVVIGGDLRKLEGAKVQLGQSLLEVGPLHDMLLELEIPDEDVSHVQPGQHVTYRLDAFPWQGLRGEIVRVHPRSEQRDGKNVFIAEVAIDPGMNVRPGMMGKARIRGDWHAVGWNLFHKPWDSLAAWIAW